MHLGPLRMQLRAPIRIAHIAPFSTIKFFSDNPEGFASLLGQCAALRS